MKKVDIYLLEDPIRLGGCGCSGNFASGGDSLSVQTLVDDFNAKYPQVANFESVIWDITDDPKFFSKMNDLLKSNGEELILGESNQHFVLPKILPMVVINGSIKTVGVLPEGEELFHLVSTESVIPKSSACC